MCGGLHTQAYFHCLEAHKEAGEEVSEGNFKFAFKNHVPSSCEREDADIHAAAAGVYAFIHASCSKPVITAVANQDYDEEDDEPADLDRLVQKASQNEAKAICYFLKAALCEAGVDEEKFATSIQSYIPTGVRDMGCWQDVEDRWWRQAEAAVGPMK